MGPYDGNVVESPHKVTLSEVCVLGAAAALQHVIHAAVKLRTRGEDEDGFGETLLRTLLY